ncbi:MAG: hypothetical protein RMN25_08570 [Anaerolineae bacterium]|nr:hypothetical protein [Thermoflexales bacterium]MDW8407826.1 hypothetical protein [Anaerolineae bacterium]
MTRLDNPPTASPAQLRQLIVTYFDTDEIEAICFDLGIDYDSLPGQAKLKKVVELIEHCGRNGQIVKLIDICAQMRPAAESAWNVMREMALSDPSVFVPQAPTGDETTTDRASSRSLINMPADRALKLGIALGALMMLLIACGFSGGLVAGRFIQFTESPVPIVMNAGRAVANDLQAIEALPPGAQTELEIDNVGATSYANLYLTGPNSPIQEIHARFLDTGQTAVNMTVTLPVLGQKQVVAAYNVGLDQSRLVIAPEAVSLRMLNTGGLFGWVAIPNFMLEPVTRFIQSRLDDIARSVSVDKLTIREGSVRLWLTKK